MVRRKITPNYRRQEIMGNLEISREPTTYEQIEISDNSQIAEALRREHPIVTAFEQKYLSRGIDWRANL